MPNKDKVVEPALDVQVTTFPPGGANGINVPSASQVGNGVVVMPLPQPPQYSPSPAPVTPTVIVITVGAKKDEEKKKKTSSVFQRL